MILIINDGFDTVLLISTSIEKLSFCNLFYRSIRGLEGVSLYYLDYNLVIPD